MKVLNLYAGIGGNRKLWPKHLEVTAIENNPIIADIYKGFFPKDHVVITDAHNYLLNRFCFNKGTSQNSCRKGTY